MFPAAARAGSGGVKFSACCCVSQVSHLCLLQMTMIPKMHSQDEQEETPYLLKIWQHILPAPARISKSAPGVVIIGISSQIHHGVDDAAAADNLGSDGIGRPVIETGMRNRLKPWVEVPPRLEVAGSENAILVPVDWTGFNDKDGHLL